MLPSELQELLPELSREEFADYWSFLRYKDWEHGPGTVKDWQRSKRKGKFARLVDSRRRKLFSPGKYHAASPTGVYLNKNFVNGWRGINPVNP